MQHESYLRTKSSGSPELHSSYCSHIVVKEKKKIFTRHIAGEGLSVVMILRMLLLETYGLGIFNLLRSKHSITMEIFFLQRSVLLKFPGSQLEL